MRGRIRRSATVMTAVALAALLAIPAGSAFAKGGPPAGAGGGTGGPAVGGGGGSHGGGGGGGETTLANNLSVPAIFVSANGTAQMPGPTCDGQYRAPASTEVPLTGFEIDPTAYYYVQGVNVWQAGCLLKAPADAPTVLADWGDNLSGTAKMSVGSPIRVEVGLDAKAQGLEGLTVVKLEPSKADRLSKYGTLATPNGTGGYYATSVNPFQETRVWDADASLTIYNKATGAVVTNAAATAEINATGRVVYGYNLRVTTAGTYTIEFRTTNVKMTNATGEDGRLFSLDIVVSGSGGGGGGGGRR